MTVWEHVSFAFRCVFLLPALFVLAGVGIGWCVVSIWILKRDPDTMRKLTGIR